MVERRRRIPTSLAITAIIASSGASAVGAQNHRSSAIREGRRCRPLLKRLLDPLEDIEGEQAADALIDYFGSLRATLTASRKEQLRAVGDARVVAYLGAVNQSMRWVLRNEIEDSTFLASTDALRDYLRLVQGSNAFEQARVFYLNGRGRLMREECIGWGTPGAAILSVGQIIGRGLEIGAQYIIMAHNHPSGDAKPSQSDRDMTRKLAIAASLVGMQLYDHLVVSDGDDFSFRENGVL